MDCAANSESVFVEASQVDAERFRTCSSSLRVRSWSEKPLHGQYRRLTEQSAVEMKKRLQIFLLQLRDWLLLLKTKLFGLGIMSATFCIGISVPLAECAVQAWRQSTK